LLLVNLLCTLLLAVLVLHGVDRPAQRWRSAWLQRRMAARLPAATPLQAPVG
jgi:peptidoglycan/LPS O-acetylase OafA/YrhL